MANTINSTRAGVEVSAMDSDYSHGDNVNLISIKFYPNNASGGEVVIYDENASGLEICRLKSEDEEPRIEYFHGNIFNPFIDYSECTLNTGHKIVLLFDRTYF